MSAKLIAGIISEYNPIHFGHIYQMSSVREMLGEDTIIICVMSGNFVQRGDFAIYDKWARAKAAVICGADVVIELPVPYVLSSAEHFAYGAVSMLNSLGVVTHISFGSEWGKIKELEIIAKTLLDESPSIKTVMQSGTSYGAACQEVITKSIGKQYGEIIRSPNNILGIEYLKGLIRLKSSIEPITITRKGSGHDSMIDQSHFYSAAYIRSEISKGEKVNTFTDARAAEIFDEEANMGRGPVFMKNAEQAVLALLRNLSKDDFSNIIDISEGIENRLMGAVSTEGSVTDIINAVKTKRYPESRIRRMILSACLGLNNGDRCDAVPYIKVLALSTQGRMVIREMSKKSQMPIITKPAKIKKLAENARRMFALDVKATDLYVLAYPENSNWAAGREWKESPRLLC